MIYALSLIVPLLTIVLAQQVALIRRVRALERREPPAVVYGLRRVK